MLLTTEVYFVNKDKDLLFLRNIAMYRINNKIRSKTDTNRAKFAE